MKTTIDNISKQLKCVALIAALLLMGCNDAYDKTQSYTPSLSYRYLKPSKVVINLGSEAMSENVEIVSDGVEWNMVNSAPWLSVSPSSGNQTAQVTIAASRHLSGDTARMSIITLESLTSDWDYCRALSVSQAAATPYLVLGTTELSFSGTANAAEIEIASNSSWVIQCDNEWVTATKISESVLRVSIVENPTNDYRKATITLSNKSGEQTITLTQFPANVSVSQTTIKTEKEAALFTLTIDSEIDWHATASTEWIQLSQSEGDAGISNLEISITENQSISERRGYVYIYTEEHQKVQIEIIQKGLYLSVIEPTISFTAENETKQLIILSNTDWVVTEKPEWIVLSTSKGQGECTLEVTTSVNNSTMPRSGIIVIAHKEVDLSCVINVEQEEKIFEIDSHSLEFGVKASSQLLQITSGLPWQSSISADWITTDLAGGEGDAIVEVSVSETSSYSERFGTIAYSVIDKDITVNVHQLAKYFTITDKAFDFNSIGGTAQLSFASNESWRILVGDCADWVALSDTVGEGNGNVMVTVADNPSINKREGILVIETSVGQLIQISITQAARYLQADSNGFAYFAAGGSGVVNIFTDGEYKIESTKEWIDLRKQSEYCWHLFVPYNENAIIREGTITILLTDLEEGELVVTIPVKQTYEGGIYIDRAFEEEINWDVTNENGFAISIKSYNMDSTWDSKHKDSIVIMKSEYTADGKYDSEDKDTTDVNKSDYSNEQDWN